MGLLTKQILKKIVEHMPEVRKKRLIKEREKRREQKELDKKVKGINLPLKKLNKLPASDILKLLYTMKEQNQEFTLT
jgi:hypothetical protein